jgi:hypothetical protein
MSDAEGTDANMAGARVFTEAASNPIAGGTWYLLHDGTVAYQHPTGERVHPAVIATTTLQRTDLFTEHPPPGP